MTAIGLGCSCSEFAPASDARACPEAEKCVMFCLAVVILAVDVALVVVVPVTSALPLLLLLPPWLTLLLKREGAAVDSGADRLVERGRAENVCRCMMVEG